MNTIRLWDAATGQQIGEPLTGHTGSSVNSVAFSPDGSRIVSGSYDTTLRLWDADSGQQIGEPLSGSYRVCLECCLQSRWFAHRQRKF